MVPVGRFEFALLMALATSSMPIDRAAPRADRHAHRKLCDPKMLTCATPLTIEMRCATCDCAISSSTDSDSVDDRRTMKKID